MRSERFTKAEAATVVAGVLREIAFRYQDEDALQASISLVLGELGFEYVREHRIDQYSRIDFIVDLAGVKVGIEVKIGQAAPEVARQIKRYMASDDIDAVVLFTTRRRHRKLKQEEFDKPIEIVWLGFAGF